MNSGPTSITMADLICAGCRSNVNVPAGYDSPTIRCGICWTELPIGGAAKPASAAKIVLPTKPAVPSKPAVAVAKSVAAVVLPTGTKSADGMAPLDALIHQASLKLSPPNAAPPPVPVVAKVIAIPTPSSAAVNLPVVVAAVAKPLAKKASAIVKQTPEPEVDPDRRQRPTKRRPRDDDEDDDQPRSKRRARQTNNTPMIATIIGGVVVLVAILGGVGYFFLGGSGSQVPTVNSKFNNPTQPIPNPNNLGANPLAFNLPPIDRLGQPKAKYKKPLPEFRPLKTARGDGLTIEVPGTALMIPIRVVQLYDPSQLSQFGTGKQFNVSTEGLYCEIKIIEVPDRVQPNLERMLTIQHPLQKSKPRTIDNQPGLEIEPNQDLIRIVQVGRRVYQIRVMTIGSVNYTNEEILNMRQRVFDSIRFTAE